MELDAMRGAGGGGRGTLRREREGVAADVRPRLAAPPCLHPLRWLQYRGTTAEALVRLAAGAGTRRAAAKSPEPEML